MTKSRNTFLSDAPPRPWILWTARGVIITIWVWLLVTNLPPSIERFNDIRAMMPPGPERQAALDNVMQDIVTVVVGPLVFLMIFGFGVIPRKATDVWNGGGPWFVPAWRSQEKQRSRKRSRRSGG